MTAVTAGSWRKLMVSLLIGNAIAAMAFSEVMPFLPYFLRGLGHFTRCELNNYSAITFASTYIVAIVLSPVWGKLGDRFGRKPILLLSSLGAALAISSLAWVTSVSGLITVRLFQGRFIARHSSINYEKYCFIN